MLDQILTHVSHGILFFPWNRRLMSILFRCQYCRALRSWIFVVFMDGLFGVFSWVKIFHGNVIHGKSVSFYFVFIWIVVFGDFFLQRRFFPPGKTKIHGKKIHSKIPWIYRTHPKIFVSKKMKCVTV